MNKNLVSQIFMAFATVGYFPYLGHQKVRRIPYIPAEGKPKPRSNSVKSAKKAKHNAKMKRKKRRGF